MTNLTYDQMVAVARLIASCEVVCESGLLNERSELLLRERIAKAMTAFGINAADRDEREAAHA